jgi:vacuolar protein sorting-associated protein 45
MDVLAGVKFYIDRMVEESGLGMKVLLMDKETTSIISMVFSQSEMLSREVYLFERMDRRTSNDPMKYLKCIVFVRPTEENIELLQKELRTPKYGQYHLCEYFIPVFVGLISRVHLC